MTTTSIIILIGGVFFVALAVIAYLAVRLMKAEGTQNSDSDTRQRTGRSRAVAAARNSPKPRSRSNGRRDTKFNWLLGRTGSIKGLSFHIGEQVISIGRDFRNHIQLSEDTASERHALLMGDPHGLQLTDLDSSNGTTLNGKPLDPNIEYELKDGDEFKIGEAIFLYRMEGKYTDDSHSHNKAIRPQKKTKALSAVSKPNEGASLKEQVLRAVQQANGDFDKVAEEVDLDVDIVKRIVQRAVSRSDKTQ